MSSNSKDTKVLVVGAGPVGLTLAFELKRRGVNCRIIDKANGPTDQSRALGIHARTLEVFENMGIVDEVLKVGQKLHGVNVYVQKRRIMHMTLDELESPYPFVISLPQSQTGQIIANELAKLGVDVEYQVELVDIVQDKEQVRATLKYADGSGMEEAVDWVVACDGAHSTVRHRLNMAFEGNQYPDAFILADVSMQTSLPQTEGHLFNGDDGLFAVFPYGNDRFRLIADVPLDSPIVKLPEEESKEQKKLRIRFKDPTLEEFQSVMDKRGPGGIQITEAKWLATFAIHRRKINHYRKGRIFIAGDAAHIHSPAGGQGLNTGIQDSFNLAWKLALVIQNVAPASLLETYDIERHGVARSVLRMTDFMTKVNTMRNPVAKNIRARLAPVLVAQEVIQQRLRKSVSELAINYRKSPIVAEHRVGLIHARVPGHTKEELPAVGEWFSFDHGPDPGDRAPDANLFDSSTEKAVRLFEVLRGVEHHLLLLAGARTSSSGMKDLAKIAKFVLEKYPDLIKVHLIAEDDGVWEDCPPLASCFSDPELSLHHRYGAASECLYLIRPDGYIGFRSLPADRGSLADYLKQMFV